ncbi:MAG: ferrochelatase [Bacteroidota bacterium]
MKRVKHRWLVLSLLLVAGVFFAGCQIDYQSVVVLFVGHGEPATFNEGLEPVQFPDGKYIGPFGTPYAPQVPDNFELVVPENYRNTLWAMLYIEVAEAIAYTMGDANNNGKPHEPFFIPFGDVTPGFRWNAFLGEAAAQYAAFGGSPHNATWQNHVNKTRLSLLNKSIDIELAYMDARPMIEEKVYQVLQSQRVDKLVVVPLLLSESTHTQEIKEAVELGVEMSGREVEIAWGHPFFVEPYVRNLHASAVAAMVEWVRAKLPAGVPNDQIGVVLAAHGDPFPPPYPEFGYEPGDAYSYVYLMEKDFHDAITNKLPYDTLMGINEFRPPSVESGIEDFSNAGKQHIIVVPANFPTPSMHTMWDIAEAAVGRPVHVAEGFATRVLPSGTTVWYTPHGYGDLEPGATYVRNGMRYCAEVALLELFEKHRSEYEYLLK